MGKLDPHRHRSAPNSATVSRREPPDVIRHPAGAETSRSPRASRPRSGVSPDPSWRRARPRAPPRRRPPACRHAAGRRSRPGRPRPVRRLRTSAARKPADRKPDRNPRAARRCVCTAGSRQTSACGGEAVFRILVPVELLADAAQTREAHQPVERGPDIRHGHVGIGDEAVRPAGLRGERLDPVRPRPRPGRPASWPERRPPCRRRCPAMSARYSAIG